jgi:hypothetical protein
MEMRQEDVRNPQPVLDANAAPSMSRWGSTTAAMCVSRPQSDEAREAIQ